MLSFSYSSKGTEPTESYGAALLFIWWANHINSVTNHPYFFLFMSTIFIHHSTLLLFSTLLLLLIWQARVASQSFLYMHGVITKACFLARSHLPHTTIAPCLLPATHHHHHHPHYHIKVSHHQTISSYVVKFTLLTSFQ